MMALCKEHYKTESDMASHYVLLLNSALSNAINLRQEALLKQLDDIHDHEVSDLRKKLDTYNHDEMKALAKKHKEKNELSRHVFSQSFLVFSGYFSVSGSLDLSGYFSLFGSLMVSVGLSWSF